MAELLLVEDDPEVRRALMRALAERGHVVSSEATGLGALRAVARRRPQLVVLDLGLPDVDGEQLVRLMRAASPVPIVVVTGRRDESVLIEVLNHGADDYVVRPFSPDQLDARIGAVLRRCPHTEAEPPVVVGELRLDPATREVWLGGARLDLTPREFDLLHYLASRAGAVVSRRELLTHVWRQPFGGPDDTVDVHLSWLRRKLGESAQAPRFLHTIRGVGVRLSEPRT